MPQFLGAQWYPKWWVFVLNLLKHIWKKWLPLNQTIDFRGLHRFPRRLEHVNRAAGSSWVPALVAQGSNAAWMWVSLRTTSMELSGVGGDFFRHRGHMWTIFVRKEWKDLW